MNKDNELNKLMVRVDKIMNETSDDKGYADVSIGYHNFEDGKYPASACSDTASDLFNYSKNQLDQGIQLFNTAVSMYGDHDYPIHSDNIIGMTLDSIYNTLNAQLIHLDNELYYRVIPIMCNELSDLYDEKLDDIHGIRIGHMLYTHLLTDIDEKYIPFMLPYSSILSKIAGVDLEHSASLVDQFYFDNDKEFEVKEDNVLKIMDDINTTSLMANEMGLRLYNFIVLNLYISTNEYIKYRTKDFTDKQIEEFYEEAYVIIQNAVITIHDSYLDHLKMVLMSAADKFPYLKEYVKYYRNRMFGDVPDNGKYRF